MPFILGANSVSGYTVKNSLRFNSGSSDDLSRTPASAGNRRTFTSSFWIKRSYVGSNNERIFHALGNTNRDGFLFQADTFRFFIDGGTYNFITNQVFRDISAWYHFVITVDTTQATSSNRIKIYVNGSQITSFSAEVYPTQNFDMNFNTATMHRIGRDANSNTEYMNAYISEFNFIDGQALDATSFGQTDTDTGIWIPKAYTGTYGTNGFYLKFANSASLGTDSSGNGNNFTVNNLTSVDQTTDTPTNNFATMNPLGNYYPASTFSEGNLKMVTSSSASTWSYNLATIGVNTGKWYWETKVTKTSVMSIGIASSFSTSATSEFGVSTADGYAYVSNGNVYNNGSTILTSIGTYTTGDIIGIALDVTNNKLYFSKNGTFINSGNPANGTNGISITAPSSFTSGNYFPAVGDDDTASETFELNFGSPSYTANSYTDGAGYGNFSYSVPSGYYALCTKNLAQYG